MIRFGCVAACVTFLGRAGLCMIILHAMEMFDGGVSSMAWVMELFSKGSERQGFFFLYGIFLDATVI